MNRQWANTDEQFRQTRESHGVLRGTIKTTGQGRVSLPP